MRRQVAQMDLTLCRESYFQFPQNWGKYSATNIGQITIHLFFLEMCKRSYDGDVISNLVCRRFDQWEQWLGLSLEWIGRSNFLCKVYQSHNCAALHGTWLSQDWGPVYSLSGSTNMRWCIRISMQVNDRNDSQSEADGQKLLMDI